MRFRTAVVTAETPTGAAALPTEPSRLRDHFWRAVKWPAAQLSQENRPRLSRLQISVICGAIFLSAAGVRLLYWQDTHVDIVAGKGSLSGVLNRYRKEARRILEDGRILYPLERPVSGDSRLLAHPPGYSILLAAIYRVGVDEYKGLWILQIVCDSAAALLIFLIALELLNWWVALTAAMMVALSPHLAYYSLLLSPDSLTVLPILLAVFLMSKGLKRPRVIGAMTAGALIGVSCWLTANAMLLSLFLGLVVLLVFERNKRLLLATVLVGSTIVVIAPITIRNFVVFHRFIPLSIQAGLSLVEGIGDYDKQGELGMPRSDREARKKDAEWNDRPDYWPSLWSPDGIERDHTRLNRGLAVVRSKPGWFLGVMARRMTFMVSYNDSSAREWPSNTATVPPIFAEAGYGHAFSAYDQEPDLPESPPVLVLNGAVISGQLAVSDRPDDKSIPPTDLNNDGVVLSPQTRVSLALEGQALEIAGDTSEYGDQFASAPIAVRKNTDYVLVLPVNLLNGGMALKVTSTDRRTTLAIADVALATQESNSGKATASDLARRPEVTTIQIPFATGNRTEVRAVLSNDGKGSVPPSARLGTVQIFETGPTPYVWTGYARPIIRGIQRNFTTGSILSLIVIGMALLLLARRGRTIVLLLIVPLYYVSLQAPLHTEYRYVLGIHYFLFVMAGVTLGCFGVALVQASRKVVGMIRRIELKHPAISEDPA